MVIHAALSEVLHTVRNEMKKHFSGTKRERDLEEHLPKYSSTCKKCTLIFFPAELCKSNQIEYSLC